MEKNFKVNIKHIDLIKFNYEINEEDEEKYSSNIDYKIKKLKSGENLYDISFSCDLYVSQDFFNFSASYTLDIRLKYEYEKDINTFIEETKKDMVFPVYNKMAMMVALISDQIAPFPLNIEPVEWLKDSTDKKENENAERL